MELGKRRSKVGKELAKERDSISVGPTIFQMIADS